MTQIGKLKPNQRRALVELMKHPTVRSAAAAANVGERTLHRWIKDDELFQAAMKDAQDIALVMALQRLAGEIPASADTLARIRDDGTMKGSTRVQAARAIPAIYTALREHHELAERLNELEARINEGSN